MNKFITAIVVTFMMSAFAWSETFSAQFKGTDIHEFINTVSKNLGKTIILDDKVKGKITVRSYEQLDEQQYYKFFLSVLDVYGYAVINMPHDVLKVIPAREGKRATLTSLNTPAEGDELVMRVVPLSNISAKDVAPLLRQLNDSIGVGSVAHYEGGNTLLITGRAEVVNALVELAQEMDRNDKVRIDTLPLIHASATEIARMVMDLFREEGQSRRSLSNGIHLVADERTNTVLISGNEEKQKHVRALIHRLDQEKASQSNTKVIRLKYAKAQSLVDVLTGVSNNLQQNNGTENSSAAVSIVKNVVIKADEQTNALIISAAPEIMHDLDGVIEQLDVRRAQVLVEAIIVEVQDGDGLNFGIQWANKFAGGVQFSNTAAQIAPVFDGGISEAFKNANGLVTGFYRGNWAGLLTAISSTSKNNILATPSIVTLDNEDAEFSVGQDVPILAGSQTTNSDNIFNTVARKTVGIKLKVKPQINKGESVLLQIQQEVSSVADDVAIDIKNDLGAVFNVRTVNNAVLVESGETVVVGGLLDKSQSDNDRGVPYLSRIPILGVLFRSTAYRESKRNLILFIRPTIIRSPDSYSLESVRKVQNFQAENRERRSLDKDVDSHLSSLRQENVSAFLQAKQSISAFYHQGNP